MERKMFLLREKLCSRSMNISSRTMDISSWAANISSKRVNIKFVEEKRIIYRIQADLSWVVWMKSVFLRSIFRMLSTIFQTSVGSESIFPKTEWLRSCLGVAM